MAGAAGRNLEGGFMGKRQCQGNIIWYSIPAYGHINGNLYFANSLAEEGFRVIYYATEEFRTVIEANGCEYRSYPIRQEEIDLSDGDRLLRLYQVILQYTKRMLPVLMEEAIREAPSKVVFDSLALWGRMVKEGLGIPGYSFYSILAVSHVGDAGFWAYSRNFSAGFLRYAGEIPRAVRLRMELGREWGRVWDGRKSERRGDKGPEKMKLGMAQVLMNQGDKNLMGYSRLFQPGGNKMGEKHVFLGPMAIHRKAVETNDFVLPKGRLIYISLGTIFNRNEKLLREIVKQFGVKKRKEKCWEKITCFPEEESQEEEYLIVMAWPGDRTGTVSEFPDNFIVRKFVNQGEILKKASLFITAGGVNSIHEALYYGVPCLLCPQQGEQLLNARQFENLGFGRILRDLVKLRREAEWAMKLKDGWKEGRRKEMTKIHIEEGKKLFPKEEAGESDGRQAEEGREGTDGREVVLVTGATGFLGEYLVRRLAGQYRVLALGRNMRKGRQLEELGAEFCQGDFTDEDSCRKYFRGVQYVIHGGALSTVWGKWEDFYKTNVLGTDLVARLCLENGVRRMVYISSPSIYSGKTDQYGIREEQAPKENNLNCYIRSKLMAEKVIGKWNRKGLETVVLRPRGLIGIGDTSLVPRLLRANAGIGIPLFREGRNLVDLTSVENVALACQLAMTAGKASGQVFNITNGEPTEFRVLLEKFLEAAGEEPCYRRIPFGAAYGLAGVMEWVYGKFGLPGEPPLTRYTACTLGFAQTMDIRKAREILGYQPEKTLAESIEEYGKWWRERNSKDPAGPGKVDRAIVCHCGFCTNNLALMFRGMPWKKRRFPASAVLIRHKDFGNILYDTGYSERIFGTDARERGMSGKWEMFLLRLYRRLNPVSLRDGDRIDRKLAREGIETGSIKKIILSHGHPDHVGGLCLFSGYELIASEKVLQELKKPGFCSLVFPSQFPQMDGIRIRPVSGESLTEHFLCRYFEKVYDLFGDGSLIAVELEGHCKGQIGLWIADLDLFLAADACWGRDLVKATGRMRWAARLIQKDFKNYRDTLGRICRMKREHPEIRVVFSHQGGREMVYARTG